MRKFTAELTVLAMLLAAYPVLAGDFHAPDQVSQEVDRLVLESSADSAAGFGAVDDATFLRRVCLDIIGRPPSPGQITRFGLDPSDDKRRDIISELLESDAYADNWSRYWRDAIFLRATNVRANLVRSAFEDWMSDNLRNNRGWDEIVTDLLTATGSVNDNGRTALIFAHEGEPEEIAAEASRLFLGIQIQCANCHNHPWDRWKREDFHEFAAFFPRVSVRRDRSSDRLTDYEIVSVDRDRTQRRGFTQFLLRRADRNHDLILSESEARNTPLARLFSTPAKDYIDKNGDGKLSLQEIQTAEPPSNNRPGQGATEHYMADLSDPGSKGDLIHPVFFVNDTAAAKRQADVARRMSAAELITAADNPWFARAIVNRMWAELTGSAFYMPIDDIGPDRSAEHEDALNVLANGFTASGYDLKWLVAAITSTRLYQRPVDADAEGFLHLEPVRLRSDQLYDALCQALNVSKLPIRFSGRRTPYMRNQDQGRLQFATTFGFDPSTPQHELTGNISEALFMINSPQLHSIISVNSSDSTIARISRQVLSDEDVVRELYLTSVSREPTQNEVAICLDYIRSSSSRSDGLEDVLWSLVNSAEFQCKR